MIMRLMEAELYHFHTPNKKKKKKRQKAKMDGVNVGKETLSRDHHDAYFLPDKLPST